MDILTLDKINDILSKLNLNEVTEEEKGVEVRRKNYIVTFRQILNFLQKLIFY